jgi:hypothetical protein
MSFSAAPAPAPYCLHSSGVPPEKRQQKAIAAFVSECGFADRKSAC